MIVFFLQNSDFFCMDESGHPIDTTYLDDYNNNEKLQPQESETIQINPNAHDTNADEPSTSSDASTEVKTQEADEENINLNDSAEAHEEAHKASATQKEQGGSPSSSSWLGSSVTGWLGVSKEEQSDDLEHAGEVEEKDIKADYSLTSSVTGWLGIGGEQKPENVEENVKLIEESYTSAVTGWLGYGGEMKAVPEKNEPNREEESEPVETFRSRRMSLDLEGSELHEKETIEMGTFGWLGSGLSSRLRFGQNEQDPGDETKLGGKAEAKKEQEVSGSWVNLGIGDILRFRNDNSDGNGKEDGIKDTEKDKPLEQTAKSENLDAEESHTPLTGEVKTETNKESQAEEPTIVTSTEPVGADSNNNIINDHVDYSDRKESNVLDVKAGLKVDQKDVSSQAVVQMSSRINSFSQTHNKGDELKNNSEIDEDGSVEMEVFQVHDSAGNLRATHTREPAVNEINTTNNNKDFLTQTEKSLGPDHTSEDIILKSMEQFEGREEVAIDQTPENVEIKNTVQNVEQSNNVSVQNELKGGDHKEELSNKTTNSSHDEMFTTQTEESAEVGRIRQESNQLHSSSPEEQDKFIPTEESFSPSIAETNAHNATTAAKTDHVETEIGHEELKLEDGSQEFVSMHSGKENTKNLYEDAPKEDKNIILTNMNQTLESPQMEEEVTKSFSDADNLKGTLKDQTEETKKETTDFKEVLNDKSTLGPETEIGDSDRIEEGGKITTEEMGRVKDGILKEEEEQQEVKEVKEEEQPVGADRNEKEKNNLDKELKGNEEKIKDSKEEENEESKMEKAEEVMELNEEKQSELEELKKEENQINQLLEQKNQARVERFKQSEEKKETLDDNNLASSFSETAKRTESRKVEDGKREKTEDEETSEKVKDENIEEEIAEKQQIEHVESGHPEDNSKEEAEKEGEGIGSEDGESSAGVAAAWMGENKMKERETKVSESLKGVAEEKIQKTDGATLGSESHNDVRAELSAHNHDSVESQIQASEQTEPEGLTESSHPPGAAESESRGAFGLFKNAFGFFSQTSTESTQSAQSFNTDTTEKSQPQVSDRELDFTTDPVLTSEQPQPTSTENIHPTAPSTTETPPKTNPLPRLYKNLLTHMSAEETAVLSELFGRHKLQFLDYILVSSEAVTAGDDQSILSDIERLLGHHREMLVAPLRLTDAPQEDKEKTRTLIALQKLEMLLKTINVTVSTGISDVSKHQGIFVYIAQAILTDITYISTLMYPVCSGMVVFCHLHVLLLKCR